MTDAILHKTSHARDLRLGRAIQLAVVTVEGAWRLTLDGQPLGRFRRQSDALGCATEIAGQTRRDGLSVELLLHDASGEVRSVSSDKEGRVS